MMKLCDLATIKTNFPEADFWIVRRGSVERCGDVTLEFNPEHIGVKVNRTDILLPDYLYYAMMNIHIQGHWKERANGSLSLVNIKVSDVRSISLIPR